MKRDLKITGKGKLMNEFKDTIKKKEKRYIKSDFFSFQHDFYFFYLFFFLLYFTLQYCIGFSIKSEVSQEEKHQYSILTHIYGI